MVNDDATISKGHHVEKIDGGAAVKKGASEVRDSQNPIKPAGLSRPQGVVVTPVEADTTNQTQNAPKNQNPTNSTDQK